MIFFLFPLSFGHGISFVSEMFDRKLHSLDAASQGNLPILFSFSSFAGLTLGAAIRLPVLIVL